MATLVVLAATMGNKYGGLKYLEGIGPNGETILDYSIYDAAKVGFKKVIFVISKYFEEEFKNKVSCKYKNLIAVEYVYQEVDLVPLEERNPKRSLLWGSAHAILLAQPLVNGSFGVINAVNFYQRESFELLYKNLPQPDSSFYTLVAFRLMNVMPESGGVTRGICNIGSDGHLRSVIDRHGVELVYGNPMYLNEINKRVELKENEFVSMNMWGFNSSIFNSLKIAFDQFIKEKGKDMKAHFSIPDFINQMVHAGTVVKAIETPGKWMGLVSSDDRSQVILRIHDLIKKEVYPNKLFD